MTCTGPGVELDRAGAGESARAALLGLQRAGAADSVLRFVVQTGKEAPRREDTRGATQLPPSPVSTTFFLLHTSPYFCLKKKKRNKNPSPAGTLSLTAVLQNEAMGPGRQGWGVIRSF